MHECLSGPKGYMISKKSRSNSTLVKKRRGRTAAGQKKETKRKWAVILVNFLKMKIRVSMITGKKVSVDVESTATVGDLKNKLNDVVRYKQQRLVFCGKVLESDDALLTSYGIMDDSEVFLLIRLFCTPDLPRMDPFRARARTGRWDDIATDMDAFKSDSSFGSYFVDDKKNGNVMGFVCWKQPDNASLAPGQLLVLGIAVSTDTGSFNWEMVWPPRHSSRRGESPSLLVRAGQLRTGLVGHGDHANHVDEDSCAVMEGDARHRTVKDRVDYLKHMLAMTREEEERIQWVCLKCRGTNGRVADLAGLENSTGKEQLKFHLSSPEMEQQLLSSSPSEKGMLMQKAVDACMSNWLAKQPKEDAMLESNFQNFPSEVFNLWMLLGCCRQRGSLLSTLPRDVFYLVLRYIAYDRAVTQ